MSEAARSRRDDPRYEPQLDGPGRDASPAGADPLAELARLVGHDDPFRGVFRPGAAPARAAVHDRAEAPGAFSPRHAPEAFDPAEAGDGGRGFHADDHVGHAGHAWEDGEGHHDPYAEAHGDAHDAHAHAGSHADPYHDPSYDPSYDEHYAAEHPAYADEAGLGDGHLAADAAAAAALPDMWARGGDGRGGQAPDLDHRPLPGPHPGGHPGGQSVAGAGFDDGRRSSARRPLAVLAAVLVLTGGGLAASFLVKGPAGSAGSNSAAATSGRGAPTIMAAAGPTKVKVDDPASTAPEDQDAALLNKNPGASSGPVRIVSSQEQPADLGQLPKSTDLADGARPLPPAAPSPFPEPKRVKTFVVHPDGTMLSADGVPVAPGTTGSTAGRNAAAGASSGASSGAFSGAVPATTPASPSAATPRGAAPPDAIAALSAQPADTAAAPQAKPARQPASPGARVASAKPNDTADSPGGAGGSFGVQLMSSPVEADANAAFAKLKKKYPSQLGALTASVHKAETGDKPIYRVRVGSMSQDEANALCSQLKGAGGSCFVVHN